ESRELTTLRRDLRRLDTARRQRAIDQAEYDRQSSELRGRLDELNARIAAERRRLMQRIVVPAHQWIPPAWLPYGAMALAEGRFVPAVLGTAGFLLLGVGSLTRSYRTTERLYLGTASGAA